MSDLNSNPQPTPRQGMNWFNWRTQQWDTLTEPPTDNNALDYLPNNPAVPHLYQLLREQGLSTLDAMIKILTIAIEGQETQKKARRDER